MTEYFIVDVDIVVFVLILKICAINSQDHLHHWEFLFAKYTHTLCGCVCVWLLYMLLIEVLKCMFYQQSEDFFARTFSSGPQQPQDLPHKGRSTMMSE